MKPITPRRADWLRTVHRLGTDLRRPPRATDIARATRVTAHVASNSIRRARRDGQIVLGGRVSGFDAFPVRLTPAALVEIGVPMVTYLAWPIGRDDGRPAECRALEVEQDAMRGRAAVRWLATLGVYSVSPYLAGAWKCERSGLDAVAQDIARRADAVVVMTDPLLLGRADVAAARAAGIPIGLVQAADERLVRAGVDLWRPPFLVPPDAGSPQADVGISPRR